MLGIPLGLAYANAAEWLIHKHILHGRGRDRRSFWSFHFHEHHKAVRRNNHVDEAYAKPLRSWNAQTKEAVTLAGALAAHAVLLPIAPGFVGAVWYSGARYYYVHRKSHLDPAWARENLPWHYDHHMAPNQEANWCVTRPWMDHLMGTREPFAGTELERETLARVAEAKAAREAKQAAKQSAKAA